MPDLQRHQRRHGLTSDDDLLKTLKEGKSSKRVLVNALYLKGGKNDNADSVPVVLELPPTVFDSILATAQHSLPKT
ncbi:AAA family ATPase [Xanthomonas phage JGB6]|nr:AAA family ATPase [Xanthomonas phage JGB6]